MKNTDDMISLAPVEHFSELLSAAIIISLMALGMLYIVWHYKGLV